ncbi:MAG: hypothetical protein DWQ08_00715 [Proteobacteria bacterium]|nr:MAG: hypothetical protein DWQ08_00715 [Pseudomonadota bacterium]
MLSKIREKATGIFAWVIVVIITIPFALWGINSYFEGGGQSVVATVEGVEIDLNTFQQAMAERRRVMAQVLQQNVGSEFFESDAFKRQVLEGLIQNTAGAHYADERGYAISETVLGRAIRDLPYFQTDGAFDPDRYQSLVANAGMSVARFEQQQRQQMITDQIQSAFTDSAFVSDSDVNRVLALLEQTRTADYAVISANDPKLATEVGEEEIKAYYESNRDAYFAPEQMRVNYVVLSVDRIAETIDVSEEEARRFYEDNAGRFGDPGQRRVSHILINLAADAGEEAVDAAREQAGALVARARAGEDFSELAREYSDDSGSAAAGGDLGVISRGAMVKPFEDAAFALNETGEVSDPVRSRFGFHVIKLTEMRSPRVKSFEEVRSEIESELKLQRAETRFLEEAETFSTIVYEQPESLDPVADDLQLEIQTTDWFSRESGDGVAANQRVRNVSFSEEVRVDDLNSEAFELDANTMAAIHMLDVRDRRQLTFDEVSDDIRRQLERDARATAAARRGEELVARLESGIEWGRVIEENGLVAERFEGTRDASSDRITQALVREIFSEVTPEAGRAVLGGFRGSDGSYVVYRLTEVNDADPAAVDDARRDAVREMLRRRQSNELYLSFQDALREAAEVTINEAQF